jgi:hypothetical protein
MKSVVQEINMDYQSSLDTIRNMTVHDKMETSGSRAVWPEVLAVYAVKVNTDPDNPQDVASMDNAKKATVEEIFWAMNRINSYVETTEETVLIEEADEDGNIIVTETTETVTTLYITVTHKTATTMAYEYGFTEEQKQMLNELLQDENASMWAAVLYGIHSADEQIVAVAESQIGNVGGQPYGRRTGKTTIYDKDAPNGTRVGETQIDLLAIGRGEKEYLVGECKYKVEPFTYGEYHKTKVKLTPLKEKAAFFYALFSRSGFDDRVLTEAEAYNNIQLFDLPQIVNYR